MRHEARTVLIDPAAASALPAVVAMTGLLAAAAQAGPLVSLRAKAVGKMVNMFLASPMHVSRRNYSGMPKTPL